MRDLNISGFKAKVHVCDIEQVATADVNGDFVYTPKDVAGAAESRTDEYAEVSMYYHSAKAYEFFRTLQGVPDAQVVVDKPLRVIANLQIPAGIASGNLVAAADPNTPLETFQNAFFSPAGGGLGAIFQQLYGFKGGALWFGQGPLRDYAYDGDVVYHELTHAVVDKTLKLEAWHLDARGAIDAPGAMNEGLADYFSSAITGDPDVGEYASKDISSGTTSVIRTLANEDKCPTQRDRRGPLRLDALLGRPLAGASLAPRGGPHQVRRGALQGDAHEPGTRRPRLRRSREAVPRDARHRSAGRRDGAHDRR